MNYPPWPFTADLLEGIRLLSPSLARGTLCGRQGGGAAHAAPRCWPRCRETPGPPPSPLEVTPHPQKAPICWPCSHPDLARVPLPGLCQAPMLCWVPHRGQGCPQAGQHPVPRWCGGHVVPFAQAMHPPPAAHQSAPAAAVPWGPRFPHRARQHGAPHRHAGGVWDTAMCYLNSASSGQ